MTAPALIQSVQEVRFTASNVVDIGYLPRIDPGPGEVLVRTLLCGISHGTELNLLRGTAPGFHRRWNEQLRIFENKAPHKGYPVRPGYECVGEIAASGPDVQGLSTGALVWLDKPHRTEHVIPASEARAALLPSGMTPNRGVFAACARIALGAVHDAAVQVGDRVVIVGLGAIGLLAVQFARLNGAIEIFALDSIPKRLAMAERFGAIGVDTTVDPSGEIRRLTGGAGADSVIETSGKYSGLAVGIACCCVAGSVVAVSSYQGSAAELTLGEEYHRNGITVSASMTVNGVPHRRHPRWDLQRLNVTARRMLADGSVNVEDMLTHVFPLEDARTAYEMIQQRPEECIRVGLRP